MAAQAQCKKKGGWKYSNNTIF